MNLCWFCAHPGARNIGEKEVEKIDLGRVCEAHIDFVVFYRSARHPFPLPVTPRNIIAALAEMEREKTLTGGSEK